MALQTAYCDTTIDVVVDNIVLDGLLKHVLDADLDPVEDS